MIRYYHMSHAMRARRTKAWIKKHPPKLPLEHDNTIKSKVQALLASGKLTARQLREIRDNACGGQETLIKYMTSEQLERLHIALDKYL